MNGLLDFSQLEEAIAPYLSMSEDDRKRRRQEQVIAAGLSLLATPKGHELPAMANAGLLAMGVGSQFDRDFVGRKADAMKAATQAMTLNEALRKQQDEASLRESTAQFMKGQTGNSRETMKALAQHYMGMGRLDAAQNILKSLPKVKSVEILQGSDGKPLANALYEDGAVEFIGLPQRKLRFGSTGGMTNIPFDEATGEKVGEGLPATMDPAQTAAADMARANLAETRRHHGATEGMARQRLAMDQANQGVQKAPEGYQWNADRTAVTAIPGGPKDTAEKDAMRKEGLVSRADFVLGQVDKAKGETGWSTAGPVGAAMGIVPGTSAYDLRRRVDSIKANIGFQELQAMREASPTGGALGQVAVQELDMLQATLSSLNPNQSPEQLREGLTAVERHYNNWKRTLKGGGGATGGWGDKTVDFSSLPPR